VVWLLSINAWLEKSSVKGKPAVLAIALPTVNIESSNKHLKQQILDDRNVRFWNIERRCENPAVLQYLSIKDVLFITVFNTQRCQ
jgi:hypothetical protein